MATLHTYYPLSHSTWMPSRKRKLSEDETNDHSPSRSPPRTLPHPKRRRFDLSRNLSRLSLFENIQSQAIIEEPSFLAVPPTSSTSSQSSGFDVEIEESAMEIESEEPLHLPTSIQPVVEEPNVNLSTGPSLVPEIRMRHTSSYELEKDRIIITDLDNSDDEAEESDAVTIPDSGSESYTVSPAYLAHISKTRLPRPRPIIPNENDVSRALVLFKPSPWSTKDAHELDGVHRARDMNDDKPESSAAPVVSNPSVDPDAMDIE